MSTFEILCLALIAVLALLTVVLLLVSISAHAKMNELRREVREDRRENMSFNQQEYEAVTRSLSDFSARQDAQLEAVRRSVDDRLRAMQSDNAEQMERMRLTVDEKLQQTLDDKLSRSFQTVRASLDEVYRGLGEMQGLAQGVGDLKKVLSNVKTRGILGEIQLGSILEQILSPGQYDENVATVPGSSERVEYAIRMPGEGEDFVWLPIDAKFPGEAYAALMDAYQGGDPAAIEQTRRQLYAFLRKSAKDIHDKYVEPPHTTDFAVMFLPFEGLYAEAVNLGMMELVQREFKIMIAGPSTMAALLNSLQMGFRTLAIQKHSGEVWKVLGSVKTEFDKFAEVLAATQKRLNQANEELDKLVGVRTRSIQRSLRRAQSLSDPDEDPLLPDWEE